MSLPANNWNKFNPFKQTDFKIKRKIFTVFAFSIFSLTNMGITSLAQSLTAEEIQANQVKNYTEAKNIVSSSSSSTTSDSSSQSKETKILETPSKAVTSATNTAVSSVNNLISTITKGSTSSNLSSSSSIEKIEKKADNTKTVIGENKVLEKDSIKIEVQKETEIKSGDGKDLISKDVVLQDIKRENDKISFEFGNRDQHLIFNKAVKVEIKTTELSLDVSVQHEGESSFTADGLSKDGIDFKSKEAKSISVKAKNGIVTFWTKSASLFSTIPTSNASTTAQLGIAVVKLFDGTAPFDANDLSGNDSSVNNNRVRAGQLVSYKFNLSLNDPQAADPTPYNNVGFETSPLAIGYVWDRVPTFCSGSGSRITGDGVATFSVLECNTGTHKTGDAWNLTANVRALPTLIDGSTYTFNTTISANEVVNTTTVTSPIITGTSSPKIDLQKTGAVFSGTRVVDGVAGGVYNYGIGIKLLAGSEIPSTPMTFTDDISGVHPLARYAGCATNLGNYSVGGVDGFQSGTIANGLQPYVPSQPAGQNYWNYEPYNIQTTYKSNAPTCTNTGQNISVSVNPEVNPPTYPTRGWENYPLPSRDHWIGSYVVAVWIPYDVFTTDNAFTIPTVNVTNNFNPVGAMSGKPNFNGLGEPGVGMTNIQTASDTNLTGTENNYQQVISRPGPGSFDKVDYRYVENLNSSSVLIGDANATTSSTWSNYVGSGYRSADGVMAANGDWTSLNLWYYSGVLDIDVGSIACTTIDNISSKIEPLAGFPSKGAFMNVGNNPTLWNSMTNSIIEYGVGGLNGVGSTWASFDDERKGTCKDADSAGGVWYTDLTTIPGGAASVTKVRLRFRDSFTVQEQNDYTAATGNYHMYLVIRHKMLPSAIPGVFVPNYGNWFEPNGGWIGTATDPSSWQTVPSYDANTGAGGAGDRVMIAGTRVRVEKTIKNTSTKSDSQLVGTDSTWYLQPTSDALSINPPGVAVNVKMTDIIPADLTYIPGSSQCPNVTYIQPVSCEPLGIKNPDGTTTLSWEFGSITAGSLITQINFMTSSDATIANNETRTNKATISADNDNSLESWRSSSASVQFLNSSAFSVSKSAVKRLVQPGDTIEYIIRYKNSGDNPIGPLDLIDWLPFNGDNKVPATNYNGLVKLTNLVQLSGIVATDVKYSKHLPTTLLASDFDPATIDPAIKWCLESEFGTAGCPANLGEVTGFRIYGPIMQSKEGGEWKTILTPDSIFTDRKGDIFTNQFKARVDGLSLPVISNNAVTRVVLGTIGDLVWNDVNQDGKQDITEPGIAGVTVNLLDSGGVIIKTMTTDANGKYQFTDLVIGNYKVEFIKPAFFIHTFKSATTTNLDSNTDPTSGITDTVMLPINGNNITIDGGMIGIDPKISIVKKINGDDANTIPGVEVPKGSTMNITFEVSNTGNALLNNILVTDDKISLITCPKTSLNPAEVMTCTATLAAPDPIIQHTNNASVTSQALTLRNGTVPPLSTADDKANAYTKATPAVKIIKKINGQDVNTAPGIYVSNGSIMNITFEVTNTGDVKLEQVNVTDNKITTSDITCPKTFLDPAETMICTATYPAPPYDIQHTNTSTVKARPIITPGEKNPTELIATDIANALTAKAVDDLKTTLVNAPITYSALANDSVPAGSTITSVNGTPVVIGTPITVPNGSVTVNTDGTITFTPNPGYTGSTSFPYEATTPDGVVVPAVDTITIVKAVDDLKTTEKTTIVTQIANTVRTGAIENYSIVFYTLGLIILASLATKKSKETQE